MVKAFITQPNIPNPGNCKSEMTCEKIQWNEIRNYYLESAECGNRNIGGRRAWYNS